METQIFLLCEIIILALIAVAFFKISTDKSWKVIFLLFFGNLILIYFVGEVFNKFHHILRDRKIFIESGHASIIEIKIILFFITLSIIMTLYLLLIKKKLRI